MIWSSGNVPGYVIDRYITGNYGEDGYGDAAVACTCDRCGGEIFEGDRYYNYDGENICIDCVGEDENLEDYEREAEVYVYDSWED